ncbi:phosphatidate cytidylyltransferase [Hyphococcus formosus]|uniref:phosphatidate cytidylyltransferase n=1 Tax=Hyphococcus formosus TaxID=3143534 RepID=UPI00398B4C36
MSPIIDNNEPEKPAVVGALASRILSAFVMIPLVVGAIFLGGPAFTAMIAFACMIMLFEWSRMVERQPFTHGFYALAIGSAISLFFAASGNYLISFVIAFFGSIVAAYFARKNSGTGVWSAFAAIYIILPCIALIWLRLDLPQGLARTIVLFTVVWAADTGAFVFGKFIGGPKISHALSPTKTWSGICGGILFGSIIGATTGVILFGQDVMLSYFLVGGGLGAASVIGDLVESGFKRNFSLKDISGFIPGHGGALDRLDGMIFATTAMTGGMFVYMLIEKLQG